MKKFNELYESILKEENEVDIKEVNKFIKLKNIIKTDASYGANGTPSELFDVMENEFEYKVTKVKKYLVLTDPSAYDSIECIYNTGTKFFYSTTYTFDEWVEANKLN